jgi:serine/threonine protein kinase
MYEQWGKYILRHKIATGGMAEIFKADMTGPSGFLKTVCLKRIKADFSGNELFEKMFEGEARIAAGLDHPNIIQVFDFDKHEDQFFLAMELVEGLDLMKIIGEANKACLRLPLGFAIYVMRELLGALAYAHGRVLDGDLRPVVHRDVSPHNILVSTKGVVKLADFGIAKARGATDPTNVGVIKGKFAYLSPEQARGQAVQPRSDLFSAGLVLWEMITGKRLFHAENEAGLIANVLNVSAPEVPEISEKLNQFISRLLEKNPLDRFQSAESALEELRETGITAYEKDNAGALVRRLIKEQPLREQLLEEERQKENSVSKAPSQRVGSGTKQKSEDSEIRAWAKSGSEVSMLPMQRKGSRALVWIASIFVVILFLAIWAFRDVYSANEPAAPLQAAAVTVPNDIEASKPIDIPSNDADLAPPVAELVEQIPSAASDAGAGQEKSDVETKNLAPKAKSEARTGMLEVNVRPWAQVIVDGSEKGTTPLKKIALQPGMHKVTLTNNELGYNENLNVRVRPGKTATINKNIAADSSREE